MVISVKTAEMKNTGELVPVTKNRDIVISQRFNNKDESTRIENTWLIEAKELAEKLKMEIE